MKKREDEGFILRDTQRDVFSSYLMHGRGGDEMIYRELSSPLTSFSGIMIIYWDPSLDSDVTDISDERYDYVLKAVYVVAWERNIIASRILSLEPKLYTVDRVNK